MSISVYKKRHVMLADNRGIASDDVKRLKDEAAGLVDIVDI